MIGTQGRHCFTLFHQGGQVCKRELVGQKRRHEIKSKPCGKHIKYHKNVLKKKLKRHNKNENCVLQLQRHCAFFFVVLLVVVMMSFGDAGGIIEEIPQHSSNNKKENVNSGVLEVKVEEIKNDKNRGGGFIGHHRNSPLGRMTLYSEQIFSL